MRLFKLFAFLAFTLLLCEIVLRAQQKLGPLYDLEFASADPRTLSDEVNHSRIPPTNSFEVTAGSIRQTTESDPDAFRILFFGDSFMAGLGSHDQIPYHIGTKLLEKPIPRKIELINAGSPSYSPLIFTVQARRYLTELKPDLIVVNFDETDLLDDYIRYRNLQKRNERGELVGIRATPIGVAFIQRFTDIRESPLYLYRMIAKIHYTRFVFPKLLRDYRGKDTRHALFISADVGPDLEERYANEIAFFYGTVSELTQVILARMKDPRRVLFSHHPHLAHFRNEANDLMWKTVLEVAAENKIPTYDGTSDLRTAFDGKPDEYYIPDDMHFNQRGLKAYATVLFPSIEQMLKFAKYGLVTKNH